jgi:hypothetical protein
MLAKLLIWLLFSSAIAAAVYFIFRKVSLYLHFKAVRERRLIGQIKELEDRCEHFYRYLEFSKTQATNKAESLSESLNKKITQIALNIETLLEKLEGKPIDTISKMETVEPTVKDNHE